MLEFPFDAAIWGTVSDWVLTIATIIALYFIYRTFQSQLVVQKSQLDLTQIEIDKYVKEDKPYFKLTEFSHHGLVSDLEEPNFVFHLKKNGNLAAQKFNVVAQDCEVEVLNNDANNIKNTEEIIIMCFLKSNHEQKEDINFFAMLFFNDRYGNNYRQVLNVWTGDLNKINASISSPSSNDRVSKIHHEMG